MIIDDHTVLNTNTLHHGRFLTVRTLTDNNGESHDSAPIDLDEVLKKVSRLTLDLSIALFLCRTLFEVGC